VEKKAGLIERTWNAIVDVIYSETMMRKTAQGAAELSQALNSQSNAYVPYGEGQKALEVEGPQQSYQDKLREASHHEQPGQGQEMER
jgi:hypothetical protein